MRCLSKGRNRVSGIALLIIITAIVILSFAVGHLSTQTGFQMTRVRNSYDRINALYLARSTLNLSRFFILMDSVLENQASGIKADFEGDTWSLPIDFPVPVEMLAALNAELGGEPVSAAEDSEGASQLKACQEFFDDFKGSARAITEDLSKKINLNDMTDPQVEEVLYTALSPSVEFIDRLNARNILREEVVQQIRDYVDTNGQNEDTKGPEEDAYRYADLDYGPKNLPLTVIDEIKLIPSIDNELFDYLKSLSTAYYFSGRKTPGKINLNTVEADVFQALLKNVSDPIQMTQDFIKDREENSRVYTDKNAAQLLEALGIGKEQIPLSLVGGEAEAFLVNIESQVGDVQIELEGVLKKTSKPNDKQAVIRLRLKP